MTEENKTEEVKKENQLMKKLKLIDVFSSPQEGDHVFFFLRFTDADGIPYGAEVACKANYEESVAKAFTRIYSVVMPLHTKSEPENESTVIEIENKD